MSAIEKNQKFGKWTTVEKVRYKRKSGKTENKWKCICECGNNGIVSLYDLNKGKSTQCLGCCGRLPKNLIGRKFGSWTVINKAPRRYTRTQWMCRCICNKEVSVSEGSLLNGVSVRCLECYKKKRENGPTSVKNRNPLYAIWRTMLARCYNEKNTGYHNYGKRGIKVCERWNSLDNFTEDMGERPSRKHTIERIDNDGNYEPLNCKWATYREQANNKRGNYKITYKDITKTMSQWAREMNIKPDTLYHYLRRHSFEDAIVFYKFIMER